MRIEKVIEKLGYKPNEARVYIAALGLGECHISDIAAKVRLPRTSVQAIVDKLHKDGLMNFYVQRRYKYWVAENPERLLASLKRREDDMRAAMPELVALKRTRKGKAKRDGDPRRSVELLRLVADGSEQPMLVVNAEIEIEYVNGAWERQFGYTLEEVRGKNPRVFQSGKTPRAVYKRMWETLNAEKLFQSDEIIDKRKDGTFFNLLTTIFPVIRSGNTFYVQILDDITARKRVEQVAKSIIRAV